MTTHPAPEPTGPRPRRVVVPGGVRWAIVLVVVVAIGWAIVAFAPRQPRPRLVSDPAAAPAATCGAFGAEPSDPVDGSVGFVPCTLPDGFVLIEPPVSVAPSASTTGTTQPYVVYYSRMIGDDAPDSIAVITVASEVPEVGGDTVVRGHPARLVEPAAEGQALQLRWTERPGVNVQISAWGSVSVAEVLEVAEDLTVRSPVPPATTTLPGTDAASTTTVAGPTTPTGAPGPSSTTTGTGTSSTPGSSATTSTTSTTSTGSSGPSTSAPTTTLPPITLPPVTLPPITLPPVIETLPATLPSTRPPDTTTTAPDPAGLGDVPVIRDLPIIGDLLGGGDESDAAIGGLSEPGEPTPPAPTTPAATGPPAADATTG